MKNIRSIKFDNRLQGNILRFLFRALLDGYTEFSMRVSNYSEMDVPWGPHANFMLFLEKASSDIRGKIYAR